MYVWLIYIWRQDHHNYIIELIYGLNNEYYVMNLKTYMEVTRYLLDILCKITNPKPIITESHR